MTPVGVKILHPQIIPYQELLGNYDEFDTLEIAQEIIPYQELLGNYDPAMRQSQLFQIIPYQELLGNYDSDHSIPDQQ